VKVQLNNIGFGSSHMSYDTQANVTQVFHVSTRSIQASVGNFLKANYRLLPHPSDFLYCVIVQYNLI